jgi:hypothetical protein
MSTDPLAWPSAAHISRHVRIPQVARRVWNRSRRCADLTTGSPTRQGIRRLNVGTTRGRPRAARSAATEIGVGVAPVALRIMCAPRHLDAWCVPIRASHRTRHWIDHDLVHNAAAPADRGANPVFPNRRSAPPRQSGERSVRRPSRTPRPRPVTRRSGSSGKATPRRFEPVPPSAFQGARGKCAESPVFWGF